MASSLTIGVCSSGRSSASRDCRMRTTVAGSPASFVDALIAKKLSGTKARWLGWLKSSHWRKPPSPQSDTWPVPIPPIGIAMWRSAAPRYVRPGRLVVSLLCRSASCFIVSPCALPESSRRVNSRSPQLARITMCLSCRMLCCRATGV